MAKRVTIGSGEFISNEPAQGASAISVKTVEASRFMTTYDAKTGAIRRLVSPNRFEVGVGNDTRFASNMTVHGDLFLTGSVFIKEGKDILFRAADNTTYGFKDNDGIVQFKDSGGTYRDIDKLRNRVAYYTTKTTGQDLTGTTIGNTDVKINTGSITDSGIIPSSGSDGTFTLGTSGTYEISTTINAQTSGGSASDTAKFRFFFGVSEDGGDSFTEIYRTAKIKMNGDGDTQAQFVVPRIPFTTSTDGAIIKMIARKVNNGLNSVKLQTADTAGQQAIVAFALKKLD